MSTVPPEKPLPGHPVRRSGCGLPTLIVGCFAISLLGFVVCGGLVFYGIRWGKAQIDSFAQEFEAQGYERQTGQMIEVADDPERDTVYVSQMLIVSDDIRADVAVISQLAEIKADIHGDVDFMGQVMKVHSGATIHGDLRVKNAQAIEIDGEVTGKISGSYMSLRYQNKVYGPGQSPGSDDSGTEEAGTDATTVDSLIPPAPAEPDPAEPTDKDKPADKDATVPTTPAETESKDESADGL